MPPPAASMLSPSVEKFSSSSLTQKRSLPTGWHAFIWGVLIATTILFGAHRCFPHLPQAFLLSGHNGADVDPCPQVGALFPTRNAPIWQAIHQETASDAFKARAIDWLANAIRIPTESYDNMQPVGIDPRWEVFSTFHAYLATAFPLTHARLKLQKINTYGLLYEWTGSDVALKPECPPILRAIRRIGLTTGTDVVPVDPSTVSEWAHPPYSGYFDGRGTSDDKNGLIGILSAAELLLEHGFAPARTFVFAFGFDEEASGGASELAKVLLNTYGEDAFAFIIDEGAGLIETFGIVAAYPGVAEKGYLDVVVQVTAPGGHSSVPPEHTSIGILAALLVQYEDNPYPVQLSRDSTPYHTMQCVAQHATTMPPALQRLVADSAQSNTALHALEGVLSKDRFYRNEIVTTTAIDVIGGGVKSNALPEQAYAVVNRRIAVESSVAAVREHDTALLQPLAARFNLSYTAFGVEVADSDSASAGGPASGALTLSDMYALDPAPVTPTDAAPYRLLAGSIKAAYESQRVPADGYTDNSTVTVIPGMMTGNTDTRYYWALTPHIFRYGHGNAHSAASGSDWDILNGIHTINESIDADDFIEIIRFFGTLIVNADESMVL
ncbi:carboxypeptidase S [Mycena galericulata]|nr:carboxypeptidase S [Mycena galericulata]